MPSSPSLQACLNTVGPSSSMWSLNQMPWPALARTEARVSPCAPRADRGGDRRRSTRLGRKRTEHACVVAAVADAIKARHAVVAAAHRLAINDAGPRAQPSDGFYN